MRLLSKTQVLELVPVSAATNQRWEEASLFPKRFYIGGNGTWKKAFWREDDVMAFIEEHAQSEA